MMPNQESGNFRKSKEAFHRSDHSPFCTFVQFLCGSFDHQLVIADKFIENHKNDLGEIVTIEDPSGACWNVNVGFSLKGEAVFKGSGWNNFIMDNSLEMGDILTFTFKGNSQFDVVIFDHKNDCEKEASLIVTSSREQHPNVPTKKRSKHLTRKNSRFPSICDCISRPGKRHRIVNGLQLNAFWEQEHQHPFVPTKKRSARLPFLSTSVRSSPICVEPEISSDSKKETAEAKAKKLASQIASKSNKRSFVAIMRPSYVKTRFFMTIPADWLRKNIPDDAKYITLQMGDRRWSSIRLQRRSSNGNGGLSTGWFNFVKDNSLGLLDICLFTLGENDGGDILLDVHIFYVGQKLLNTTLK